MSRACYGQAARWFALLGPWLISGCELVSGLSQLDVQPVKAQPDSGKPQRSDAGDAQVSATASQPEAGLSASASGASSVTPSATASTLVQLDASVSGTAARPDVGVWPDVSVSDSGHDSGVPDASGEPDTGACAPLADATCDPVAQCGCSGDQVCTYALTFDQIAGCFTPGTVRPANATCTEPTDCGAGYYCHTGICTKACHQAGDCGINGAVCSPDDSSTVSGIGYCANACDPLAAASSGARACGAGAVCSIIRDHSGVALHSECTVNLDNLEAGAACESAAECGPGLDCTESVCTPLCEVGGADCTPGTACVSQLAVAGTQVGVCQVVSCAPEAGNDCAVLPISCGCDTGAQCQVYTSDGATACLTEGDALTGEACSSDEDCNTGLTCIGDTCLPYCDADWPCSDGDCAPIAWTDGAYGGGQYCASGVCDPLDLERDDYSVSPCASSDHCNARFGVPDAGGRCVDGGNQNQDIGETCSFSYDCVPGAGCACLDGLDCDDSGEIGTCLAYCEEDWECDGLHPRCVATGYSVKMCVDLPTDASECLLTHQGTCDMDSRCAQIASDGTTQCVPMAQEACASSADCVNGLVCGAGLCRPSCASVACTEGTCSLEPVTGGTGTAKVCMGRCDPVEPYVDDGLFTPCGDGAVCVRGSIALSQAGSQCSPATNQLALDAVCTADTDCELGLACDTVETIHRCTTQCRSDADCDYSRGPGWLCDVNEVTTLRGYGADATDFVGVCYQD